MGCAPSLPPDARTIEYHSLLSNVQTGDILLYAGRGFSSGLIRCGSLGTNWSHTGVVVVWTGPGGSRIPYVIESNPPTGLRDAVTMRTDKSGPQMLKLCDRLQSYDGFFIAWRPLRNTSQFEGDPTRTYFYNKLNEFIKRQLYDTKYDFNPITFWGVMSRSNTDSSKNYFCTEFAAAALVYSGILRAKQPCENYSLDDFTSMTRLPTVRNLEYDSEIYLLLPIE